MRVMVLFLLVCSRMAGQRVMHRWSTAHFSDNRGGWCKGMLRVAGVLLELGADDKAACADA